MNKVTINVYQFHELDDAAKDKAIYNYSDINLWGGWWEGTYEDAKSIGLKLTSFGLDRSRQADGEFIDDADYCANKIISEHGKHCPTYKTAANYLDERSQLDIDEQEDELSDLDEQFLKDICEDYSIMLQNEYEYLYSDEAIIEGIVANEYEFDEFGNKNRYTTN